MKTIILFLATLLISTIPCHAQLDSSDIITKMKNALDLQEDQVTNITPIIEKYTSKREELRQSMEDGTADRDSMRSQMKQLKTDETQELSQVLSADQVSQWEQMMNQHRHKQNYDGGAEGSSGPGEGNNEGGGNGGGE